MGDQYNDDDPPEPGCCACFMELCGLVCCPPIPSHITAKLAFLPPEPSSYDFLEYDDGSISFMIDETGTGRREQFKPNKGKLSCMWVSSRGNKIAAYFHKMPNAKLTILFSHGNAVDIGLMARWLAQIAEKHNVNVITYDYAGYGASEGSPREAIIYDNIRSTLQWLEESHGVEAKDVVLYGWSIGTAATIELASKMPDLRAVIIHSGLMTGIRVLRPECSTTVCCDPFQNINKIGKINVPTLVIHGKDDRVIGFEHGVALHDACPGAEDIPPVWVEGADHNDVELFKIYETRMKEFMQKIS